MFQRYCVLECIDACMNLLSEVYVLQHQAVNYFVVSEMLNLI